MKSWLPALALLSVGACSESPSTTVVDAGLVSDVAAVDGGAAWTIEEPGIDLAEVIVHGLIHEFLIAELDLT